MAKKPQRGSALADFGVKPIEDAEVETDFQPGGRDRSVEALASEELEPELVEYLNPSQMWPDPFQPRVSPLPSKIRKLFWDREIDAYEAARQWIQYGENDPNGHGRRLQDYLETGRSMEENGQINPITGTWREQVFLIETGEQRFWCAIINSIQNKSTEEPLLRVFVTKSIDPVRQIIENRHVFKVSAVTQAREIARLVLAYHDFSPPGTDTIDDGYAYFRQVFTINRISNGVWAKIEPVMKVSARRMKQLLELLRLPGEMLDLIDLYLIPDTTVRAVMKHPEENWLKFFHRVIEAQLTAKDVDELPVVVDDSNDESNNGKSQIAKQHIAPAILATRGIRRFYRAITRAARVDPTAMDTVADEIYSDGRAHEVLPMLEELVSGLKVRLDANQDIENIERRTYGK